EYKVGAKAAFVAREINRPHGTQMEARRAHSIDACYLRTLPLELFLSYCLKDDESSMRLLNPYERHSLEEKIANKAIAYAEAARERGYLSDALAVDFIVSRRLDKNGVPIVYFIEAAAHFSGEDWWNQNSVFGTFRDVHFDAAHARALQYKNKSEGKKPLSSSPVFDHSMVLDQPALRALYQAQMKGNWRLVQDNQPQLQATMLRDAEHAWDIFQGNDYSYGQLFNMSNPNAQEHVFDSAECLKYNLYKVNGNGDASGHLIEFDDKSEASTAGIRAFINLLISYDPNKMYNDRFLALLIEAEARFLKEVHAKLRMQFPQTAQGVEELAERLRREMPAETISVIEEIYRMPLEEVIPFLRDNVVKLVGGEVRVHTAKFVEMETRMLAAHRIYTITTARYTDSVTIYMFSFLTFILGACGATHYTSSHSANYLYGRKVLSSDGSQLLPDVYERYRQILRDIIVRQMYKGNSYTVRVSAANDSHIMRTLTYERMAKLYAPILNISKADIEHINEATRNGHRIVLNCLNGSTYRTLIAILNELGIDTNVFIPVNSEEHKFFNAGYMVLMDKEGDHSVEHLGIDTTLAKVVRTIPYAAILAGEPIGRKVYELDPDSDRFVLKQIVANNSAERSILTEYGLTSYKLDEERLLVAPSPNKTFLVLDIVDFERMNLAATWAEYLSLYFITYVSTNAWVEFAQAVKGIQTVMAMVGYKNLTALQRSIEDWYFGQPHEMVFTFSDQLGNSITLERNKFNKLRVHSKQEESGGRVAGTSRPVTNVMGQKVLAMPEKSAADSLVAELVFSSAHYLENNGMSGTYSFTGFMDGAFKRYSLVSKIDERIDIEHGQQGIIASMMYDEQQAALARCKAVKTNFNNFFFSLGKAVREGRINIERAGKILSEVMPRYSGTWNALVAMTLTEEDVAGGRTRPEGVPMYFRAVDGETKPLVTKFAFRPSGTDPLKSKVYFDAETVPAGLKDDFEKYFILLTEYDLYAVLAHYGIEAIVAKPENIVEEVKNINEVSLRKLELGVGPQALESGSSSPINSDIQTVNIFASFLADGIPEELQSFVGDIMSIVVRARIQNLTNIEILRQFILLSKEERVSRMYVAQAVLVAVNPEARLKYSQAVRLLKDVTMDLFTAISRGSSSPTQEKAANPASSPLFSGFFGSSGKVVIGGHKFVVDDKAVRDILNRNAAIVVRAFSENWAIETITENYYWVTGVDPTSSYNVEYSHKVISSKVRRIFLGNKTLEEAGLMRHSEDDIYSIVPSEYNETDYTYALERRLNIAQIESFISSLTPENAAARIAELKRQQYGSGSSSPTLEELRAKKAQLEAAYQSELSDEIEYFSPTIKAIKKELDEVNRQIAELERKSSSPSGNGGFWSALGGLFGNSREVREEIERLKSGNILVKIAAAKSLGELGNKEAVPALLEALADQNFDLREAAFRSLGMLNALTTELKIKIYTDDLKGPAELARRAVIGLAETKDRRVVPLIIEALNNEQTMHAAARVLADLGDTRAVLPLIQTLRGVVISDLKYCRTAAIALSRLARSDPDSEKLYEALKSDNVDTRDAAAGMLRKKFIEASTVKIAEAFDGGAAQKAARQNAERVQKYEQEQLDEYYRRYAYTLGEVRYIEAIAKVNNKTPLQVMDCIERRLNDGFSRPDDIGRIARSAGFSTRIPGGIIVA
ncbi:MAG: HEAT repeat domain-containing protein, partial [Candidatus Omnitrophota bacterium]